MDPHRFDTLVRSLNRATTRRGTLTALLAGLVAPLLPGLDAAADRGKGRSKGQGSGKHKGNKRKGGSDRGADRDGGSRGKPVRGEGRGRRKGKGRSDDRRKQPAQPACREEGHPCEGNQECCDGLACRVSSPGQAERCVPCGGAEEICCDADRCDDGFVCDQGGFCVTCGGNEELCCADDSCDDGFVCDASGVCLPCGDDGARCCAGRDACGEGLVCDPQSERCTPCPQGQIACANRCIDACTASDACHLAGECDPDTGECTNPRAENGTRCGDGNACNDEVCADGRCVTQLKPNGTGCNADNDSCTVGDSCQNGVCTPGAGVDCRFLDGPCSRGVCQPDGTCAKEPRNNDELCLAGANLCTDVGACRNGSCVAGSAVVCTAADECHVAGVCDPETGRCSNPAAPDGTDCGTNGQCQNGRCVEPCLAVNAVCDPNNDTCCSGEGGTCGENAACSEAGEGRCCRPEGAFCERPCDCCEGVCAGGVCCQPFRQCNAPDDCCEGYECINNVCEAVCGTDRAFCGDGPGQFPCCDGFRCFDGECWPETCLALTEHCTSANQCCPEGILACETAYNTDGPICCHPYNQRCQDTDECCGIMVCGSESNCCLGRPFDPDRNTVGFAICRDREHECCPGLRCHPLSKFCCVDEGQPVPPPSPLGGGFIECCHFAEQDGVCTCHRKGETCAVPGGNPFLTTCCDGLWCVNNICNTPCNPFFPDPSLPCCIGCTHNENTGICDCPFRL